MSVYVVLRILSSHASSKSVIILYSALGSLSARRGLYLQAVYGSLLSANHFAASSAIEPRKKYTELDSGKEKRAHGLASERRNRIGLGSNNTCEGRTK